MTEQDHAIMRAADLPVLQRRAAAVELGLSSPRFHQRLIALVATSQEAEAAYPVAVHRWRRIMEASRGARRG